MTISDYFDPVTLNKPSADFQPEEYSFATSICIHTHDNKPRDTKGFQVAILGVCEDRQAASPGSSAAPDAVRAKLYQLARVDSKATIIDLGNLKPTQSVTETYFGIQAVLLELFSTQTLAIIIGGSQDLTHGAGLAFSSVGIPFNLVSIDARIDLSKNGPDNSRSYLNSLIYNKRQLKSFTNLGHQGYFTDPAALHTLYQLQLGAVRLGELSNNIQAAEPILRDAHICSFDMGAVKQSEAIGVAIPSPNGFTGTQACQLARYCGASDQLQVFGIFETLPHKDSGEMTSHLAAQMIWYFIEGLNHRAKESPSEDDGTIRKHIVSIDSNNQHLVFYKSNRSGRWWMEVPVSLPGYPETELVASSYEEYQQACQSDIPERWLRMYNRLNP